MATARTNPLVRKADGPPPAQTAPRSARAATKARLLSETARQPLPRVKHALRLDPIELQKEVERRKDDHLIDTKEVRAIIKCSRHTVQRRLKSDPLFPRPVRALLSSNRFWESEIYEYLRTRQDEAASPE